MQSYVVLNKKVGETPLQCAETWRANNPEYKGIPLAYAGRLDPLASGKLLVLIGEECKRQSDYHNLDKQYQISVLFGLASDTGDVMGLLTYNDKPTDLSASVLETACKSLVGEIELPYPVFSAKTVAGKPLHTWAMENRLDEITIPTKRSTIYKLKLTKISVISAETIHQHALTTINSIPPVTELRKALGNDFRREDIRHDWQNWLNLNQGESFQHASINCIASSGTYMRTLANTLANKVGTVGLATSIHRTHIGKYQPLPIIGGFWKRKY